MFKFTWHFLSAWQQQKSPFCFFLCALLTLNRQQCSKSVQRRTVRSALELVNTALLLLNPACVCLNLLVSFSLHLSHSDAVEVCQQTAARLCSVVSCYHGGDFQGIPRSHHFHTRAPCMYTHKKCLSFFIVCSFFFFSPSDVFFSLVLSPILVCVGWLCCISVCLSVVRLPLHPPQIRPHDDFAFFFVSGCLWLRRQVW